MEKAFDILWGDNVYENVWQYFKCYIVRLLVQSGLGCDNSKLVGKVTKPPTVPNAKQHYTWRIC